jgi:uncharacterized membrane protein
MDLSLRLLLLRLLALLALGVSAALLVNSLAPGSGWCGFDSSCQQVTHSSFAQILGVPLPVFGLVGFGALLGLSFSARPSLRRWFRALALLIGLGGGVLLGLQALVIRHYCPFCLLVDTAALAVAFLAVGCSAGSPLPSLTRLERVLWGVSVVVVPFLAPLLASVETWAGSDSPRTAPHEVRALWVPDKVTLVEAYDFQCSHCRKMHPVVLRLLQEQGDRIHYVGLAVPMPSHPEARPASRAYLCALKQGKAKEMADALITSSFLDAPSCERLAGRLGLSLPAYRACLSDPAIDQRLDADVKWLKAASPNGLPVIWIGDEMFSGSQTLPVLREAVRRAQERLGK